MPLFGTHVSTAGGVWCAPERGKAVGVSAIQLFAKNNNQWLGRKVTAEEAKKFLDEKNRCHIQVAFSHAGYLINLASPDEKIHTFSLRSMQLELELAERLGLDFVVLHPGAHRTSGEKAGIAKIVKSLNRLFEKTSSFKVPVLLETTAGQGSSIGHTFEQLADILKKIDPPERVGICLDTCHVFAAGYDFRTKVGYQTLWKMFDKILGLEKLKAIHLNDSKKELGSRVDRHEHIGKGLLGIEAFRLLVNDKRFAKIPMVLETPKGEGNDFIQWDRRNLKILHALCK